MNENKNFETVRIVFEKTGTARFISHLDLNRTMTRALRRLDLPLWYTEGFNRRPYLTFPSPLSLGSESTCERMDFRLCEPVDLESLPARFNETLPAGLRVVSAAPAVMKAGKLGFASYKLTLDLPAETVEAFLAQESILVEKKTKKGALKEIEIRPALSDTTVTACDGGCELCVTLPCGGDDTVVNPALLHKALEAFAGREIAMKILRTALLSGEKTDFC